jgi:hypothetical protein
MEAFVVVVGASVLLLLLPYYAAKWILRPMSREARALNLPRRYTLGDLVWLLVMLQMALGAAAAVTQEELGSAGWRITLGTVLCGIALVLWVFGVNSLSRAGVTRPLRRGVFVVFLLPAVLLFLMATAVGGAFILAGVTGLFIRGEVVGGIASVGGAILWLVICWSLRKVAQWVLSPSRRGSGERPSRKPILPCTTALRGRRAPANSRP